MSNYEAEEEMWDEIARNDRGPVSGGSVRRVGPHPSGGLDREMQRRAELEDEYGGGAGDWDR